MTYTVKEVFLTLQGEGARAGSKAVFVRFAGCNLWNGTVEGRAKGQGHCARWCDTDFFKGDRLTAAELVARMGELWSPDRDGDDSRWCVLTGGEPTLQVDAELVEAMHDEGWFVAMESNGTLLAPANIDWLTISPKKGSELSCRGADELKVVLPGSDIDPWTDAELEALEANGAWENLFVQAQDPIAPQFVAASHLKRGTLGEQPAFNANVERCVDFVMRHPRWRLSYQVHKAINVP